MSKISKHIFKKFAIKFGLLYFGAVDQKSDEHQIVRGFTVSSTHIDNHFCAGTSDGYDIHLVSRKDIIHHPNGSVSNQNWIIMTFGLHTKNDLPHFFIAPKNHDISLFQNFFYTFSNISEIELGAYEQYSDIFTYKYAICARQSMTINTQKIIDANASSIIGKHFWPLAIEQNEHVLYIYSSAEVISENLLKIMYENGLWLAGQIDYQAELV